MPVDAASPRGSVHSLSNGLDVPLLHASTPAVNGVSASLRPDTLGELGRLLRLAWPLVLQNLGWYTLSIVSSASIGHLNDPVALSSAVLAGSFFNITGFSMVVGLAAGMETLCGQAYGAGNYAMLGLVLQRALLICWAACLPIALFWSQAHRVLGLLHQQPEIVAGASRYLAIATPALFLTVVSTCLYRYLVSQQEVRPPAIFTSITALLCPLYNWLLIYRFQMGLDGAAWAFVASNATYTLLLSAYTIARDMRRSRLKCPQRTWPGLSMRALEGWGTYLRFALPAAAMICMEWWMFELAIFMSGTLGSFADVAVAVMGLTFNISSWTYMAPMSLGTAANTRVANALGAGSASAARLAARTAIATAMVLQACISGGLFLGRHVVVKTFTSQPDIVYHVGRVMPALAASVLGDGLVAVLGGVLRGSGRQSLGAAFNLLGYWCVGCPVALLLGFRAHLNVLGFWCGLATATSLQAIILGILVSRFDWDREVQRAAALVSEHATDTQQQEAGRQQLEQEERQGYGLPAATDEEAGRREREQGQGQKVAAVKAVEGQGVEPGVGRSCNGTGPACGVNGHAGEGRLVVAAAPAGVGAHAAADVEAPAGHGERGADELRRPLLTPENGVPS